MLRWIVLLGAFALWLGCMAIVYLHCRPLKVEGAEAASRSALEQMFAENAVEAHAWNIFVDPADVDAVIGMLPSGDKVRPNPEPRRARSEWSGVNEVHLVRAGRLETRVKNRRHQNLDEETSLKLDIPGTQFSADYTGMAHLTSENGLYNLSSELKIGFGGLHFEVHSSGVRDGDDLKTTLVLMQNEQTLYTGQHVQRIGGNSALTAELSPFRYYKEINLGFEWTVMKLDFDMDAALAGDTRAAQPVRVRCIDRTNVVMNGITVAAFLVTSDDRSLRAWYSPDGTVLKQAYRLFGKFEVALVKDDTVK